MGKFCSQFSTIVNISKSPISFPLLLSIPWNFLFSLNLLQPKTNRVDSIHHIMFRRWFRKNYCYIFIVLDDKLLATTNKLYMLLSTCSNPHIHTTHATIMMPILIAVMQHCCGEPMVPPAASMECTVQKLKRCNTAWPSRSEHVHCPKSTATECIIYCLWILCELKTATRKLLFYFLFSLILLILILYLYAELLSIHMHH